MRVGVVGLGRLGLPFALAVEAAGHEVRGADRSPEPERALTVRRSPRREVGMDDLLATSRICVVPTDELARWAELVFVAVETPHGPAYSGEAPMPEERADFEFGGIVGRLAAGSVLIDPLGMEVDEQDARERDITVIQPGRVVDPWT